MATFGGAYLLLGLQATAVVAGAVVLSMLTRGIPRAALVPTTAAVLLGVVALSQLWGSAGSFDVVRSRLPVAPGTAEREQCMIEGGHPDLIPFARWINARVPPGAEIAYVTRSFDRPCFQFALLPRRMVSDVATARYVMYLDPPREEDRKRLRREHRKPASDREIEFYSPTWALERRG
jgi:hypothetical protein